MSQKRITPRDFQTQNMQCQPMGQAMGNGTEALAGQESDFVRVTMGEVEAAYALLVEKGRAKSRLAAA